MRALWRVGFAVLCLGFGSLAWAQNWPPASWLKPAEPVKLADNLYFVGTAGLSSFLLTSPKGHILIDAPMEQNVDAIERNIVKLGFKLRDVKILLNSHGHFDHAAGFARLKRDTGARLMISEGDRVSVETGTYLGSEDVAAMKFPPAKVDHVLKDGEQVRLGNIVLTANMTPGHTRGCTTWTFPVRIDKELHQAVLWCSTTVAANRLVNRPQYPGIVADYRRSFVRLASMRADVFLAPHTDQFDFDAKIARAAPGKPSPFVDASELATRIARSSADFEAELVKQEKAQ
jgi:metallo-beta-lactamase class B